jgi:hypothetical protein
MKNVIDVKGIDRNTSFRLPEWKEWQELMTKKHT